MMDDKGHDGRIADKAFAGVYGPAIVREYFPTTLLDGGYDHRRAVPGHGPAGGGGFDGFYQLFDYRLLRGRVQRLCHPHCTAVWLKGFRRPAPVYGEYRVACGRVCGGARRADGGVLPAAFAADADAGGYHRQRLRLHRHYFCGHSGNVLL